jgi:FixJ family two-component response regulator
MSSTDTPARVLPSVTGRIVFLTGHAGTHPLVVETQRIGEAEILSKPIGPDHLQAIVEEAGP